MYVLPGAHKRREAASSWRLWAPGTTKLQIVCIYYQMANNVYVLPNSKRVRDMSCPCLQEAWVAVVLVHKIVE